MSARVVFIGEKLQASGLALSGARVLTPGASADAIWDDFIQARDDADLILISEAYAALLGARLVRYQQQVTIPPVLSIPAPDQKTAPVRETIRAARASLGLS